MPEQLKRYELLRQIATGGMAEVHLARTTGPLGIQKLLVVKRLLPELAANKQFVRMFLDEARLAVALEHPNIVQVYDVDEVDGTAFYGMELVQGKDLRRIVRQARVLGRGVPLGNAIAIAIAMCQALHYAHEKVGPRGEPLKIVHRDVSPHNVLVRYDGLVKIIDFGIAKAANRLDHTAVGTLKGKFGYMSPEQCLAQAVDGRSDVFCIAIVLWELTTGQRLFHGTSEYQFLKAVVETDAPSPSSVVPGYPIDLERIVMKGLVRDRTDRYRTADAMLRDLERFARTRQLDCSQTALASWIEELFPGEVASWRRGEIDACSGASDADDAADDDALTLPAEGMRPDETRTASVTETMHPASRRSLAVRVAFALSAVALLAGATLLLRARVAAPPSAAEPSVQSISVASAPPLAPPPPAPPPVEPTSQALVAPPPVDTSPKPRAMAATARSTTRAPQRPATTASRRSTRPDPDAPLPF